LVLPTIYDWIEKDSYVPGRQDEFEEALKYEAEFGNGENKS